MKSAILLLITICSFATLLAQSKLTSLSGQPLVGQFQDSKTIVSFSANSTQELSIRVDQSKTQYYISSDNKKLKKTDILPEDFTLSKRHQHFITIDLGISNNKSTKLSQGLSQTLNPSLGYTFSTVPLTFDQKWGNTTTRWAKYWTISPKIGFSQINQLDTINTNSLDAINKVLPTASIQTSFLLLPITKFLTRESQKSPIIFLSGNIGVQTFTNASETPKYVSEIYSTSLGSIGQGSSFEGFVEDIKTDLKLTISGYIPLLIPLDDTWNIPQLSIGMYYQHEIGLTNELDKNWRFGPIFSISPKQLTYGSDFKIPGSLGVGVEFREESNETFFVTGTFSF